MTKINSVNIEVTVDENLIPDKIKWFASDSGKTSDTNAFLLSVWDHKSANSANLNLWTKEMSIEEMSKFYFQTYITMAETFVKATSEEEMGFAMREFAEFFGEKMGVIAATGKFNSPE